ncbi:MAG: hypothetical protein IIB29_11255 [Chloroflexi bacterium]|nr:hypothetical protein [Chloroflexota bacterium]
MTEPKTEQTPRPDQDFTPIRTRPTLPPSVQADRMQRYSIYLMVCAFLLIGANAAELTVSGVLWFAAGLSAGFALMCATTVVILNALAWNFDRLAQEFRSTRPDKDGY